MDLGDVTVKRKFVVTAAALALVAAPLDRFSQCGCRLLDRPGGGLFFNARPHDSSSTQLALNSEVVATSVTFRHMIAPLCRAPTSGRLRRGRRRSDRLRVRQGGRRQDRGTAGRRVRRSRPRLLGGVPHRALTHDRVHVDDRGVPGVADEVRVSTTSRRPGLRRRARLDLFSPAVHRGYRVIGAITDMWGSLGGPTGTIGQALTDEMGSANGGRYNLFQRGAIYWTASTGAHMVRGAIRDTWGRVGAEWGVLGYPKTDEIQTGGRPGAVNLFQGGSVYWSSTTGAHAMYGAILQAWGSQGYEAGRLGFPRTDEFDAPDGRKQEFQGGNIVWTPAQRGAVIAYR